MKTLKAYADDTLKFKDSPHQLKNLQIEIASKFAYLSEEKKAVMLERAAFWGKKFAGDKALSDTHLEAMWNLTEGGQKELKLRYEMKALEKLMSAIQTSSVVSSIEARNIT